MQEKYPPGRVRDAIVSVLSEAGGSLSVSEIERNVEIMLGPTPKSSIRSYLRLNTNRLFSKDSRGVYRSIAGETVKADKSAIHGRQRFPSINIGHSRLIKGDCLAWLSQQKPDSIHAVVTDPPYGLHEYSPKQVEKMRNGRGGVWRIPPSFDGNTRSPLPRFTTLTVEQLDQLSTFFEVWAKLLIPVLVPGANVIVASNPLLSYLVSGSLASAGLERRGEIIRLTMTMRGGDRPKNAHEEFPEVSVMPRSMWEPWLVFRKPLEGRVQDNLRKWGTGGFRRISDKHPFGDVISCAPTRKSERALAQHPSLKPQAFLRKIVRAVLPLGTGRILDPFAGSGSTLAACNALEIKGIGIESDEAYFNLAAEAIPRLTKLKV